MTPFSFCLALVPPFRAAPPVAAPAAGFAPGAHCTLRSSAGAAAGRRCHATTCAGCTARSLVRSFARSSL